MQIIFTQNAPSPAGHYSQAVVHNGLVYISGQLPLIPNHDTKKFETIEEQTLQVLNNINEILIAAGSDKNHVLKITIYIADISLWSKVNQVYSDFFGDHKPARTIVPSSELHYRFSIEMDVIAAQAE